MGKKAPLSSNTYDKLPRNKNPAEWAICPGCGRYALIAEVLKDGAVAVQPHLIVVVQYGKNKRVVRRTPMNCTLTDPC